MRLLLAAVGATLQSFAGQALAAPPSPSALVVVDPPTLPVSLGQAWSFASGPLNGRVCVDGEPSKNIPRRTYAGFGAFSDNTSLAEAFNVSAKAQASFIIGSASAEVKYLFTQKKKVTSDNIVLYASIRDLESLSSKSGALALDTLASKIMPTASSSALISTATGIGIGLTSTALNIIKEPHGAPAFRSACGDGYVAGVESGADLVGFYSLNTSDLQTKTQSTNKFSGNILKQSAGVDLSSTVDTLDQHSAQLTGFQQFGGSPKQLPVNKDSLVAALKDFPSTIPSPSGTGTKTGVVYKIYIAPYGPSTISNWPKNQPAFTVDVQSPLEKLVEQYWLLEAINEQLQDVIDSSSSYILTWGISLNDVKQHQASVLNSVQELRDEINSCTPGPCNIAPPMPGADAYYDHLVRVPLPISWSPEYASLSSSYGTLRQVVDQYNSDHGALIHWSQSGPNGNIFSPSADPTCYQRNRLNHSVMVPYFQQKVRPILDSLRNEDRDFPSKLRQNVRNTQLESTNKSRCAPSPNAFGCVSAVQLDAYVQQMPSSAPHGVGINDSDDHVFGECPPDQLTVSYSQ